MEIFFENIIPPITQKFRLVLPKWTNFNNCKWLKNRVCNCFLVLKYTKKTWFHEFSYCLRDFVKILTKSFFYHSAYWASAFLTIWTSRRSMCWSCIIWFHEKKLYSDPNLNSPILNHLKLTKMLKWQFWRDWLDLGHWRQISIARIFLVKLYKSNLIWKLYSAPNLNSPNKNYTFTGNCLYLRICTQYYTFISVLSM